MKILWLSENPAKGKIPRHFEQMRTEFSWIVASDGKHQNIGELPNIPDNSYDIAIIILPKREEILMRMSTYAGFDLVGNLRRVAKKIGWMQEGNAQYFQTYSISIQIWWYSVLDSLDFLMVHNEYDKNYIKGLFQNKKVFINRSLMIEDNIKIYKQLRNNVIIGGTMCEWYNGFSSYMIATRFGEEIYAPSMGRMKEGEETLKGINYLPYMTWLQWINNLSQYRYAVHMMPTVAAGTFSLNCAYLGIPTLGNRLIDSQQILFPDLSIDVYDMISAIKIADKLKNKDFYQMCSEKAKQLYYKNYTEKTWRDRFFNFLSEIF